MSVYGYTRVSTIEQTQDNRSSLEDQKRSIMGIALIQNTPILKFFEDPAVSGSAPLFERPAGRLLMAELRAGDTIITAKMDRLFRSARDALNMLEYFKKGSINLIIGDMGTEPLVDSIYARFFVTVMAAMAEFEKNRILERMELGRISKKARGGHIGGVAPYGFRVIGAGREADLVEEPHEQGVIARARALQANGHSLRSISLQLNHEGHRSRSETIFGPQQIARMLKSA